MIHFRNIEDYQFLLNSLIEDDKSKQDIILIHLSDELNDKTFRERKRLLEVVYKYAIDNRFIFVYDQDIFEKIKEDFDIGNVNIIKFKCLIFGSRLRKCLARCSRNQRCPRSY